MSKFAMNSRKTLFVSRSNCQLVRHKTEETFFRTLHKSKRDFSEKLKGLITKLIVLMEQKSQARSKSPTPPSSPRRA